VGLKLGTRKGADLETFPAGCLRSGKEGGRKTATGEIQDLKRTWGKEATRHCQRREGSMGEVEERGKVEWPRGG